MEEVIRKIEQMDKKKSLSFVAIDGIQGSGKTTLVRHTLQLVPDVQPIFMDDFYTGPENEDHMRVLSDVIRPLRENKVARFKVYDWSQNTFVDAEPVKPEGVVLIEGTYAMEKKLIREYDLKIWVECPWNVGLKRALTRDRYDFQELWENKWIPEAREYIKLEEPYKNADLVVDYLDIPPV